MRFGGKTVVVTGGCRGIGRAVATAFAEEGARVVVGDIDPVPVTGVEVYECDVADEAQVETLMQQAGDVIHVLVNNAGISVFSDFDRLTTSDFDRVIAVNLRGPYLCTRFAAERLRASGSGAVINVASTRALQSEPGGEAYGASKGGLQALTHAMALSLGPHVRVNAISPGWIDVRNSPLTEADHAQHPVGRVGRPEDIAKACLFLADSEASGFMTGENIVIDGGMTKKMIYV